MERRTRRQSVWALALLLAIPLQALAADPLPSWNDGPVKQSIDDAGRESAYEENNDASLKAAREGGWAVVSMRQDWKRVFPQEAR
ncbi:hypothetical protein ACQKGO_21000 [Corallococcus interemptor]|uniref:hypothetical protein n=1 Tax=Corallococcus interemptor TaxID=2316720 RepID=UPI003D02E22D